MEQIFKKWYPYDNLDTMYDVDDIWMRQDGYTLILLPDGRYKEELEGQRLMFTWESIVSYQLSGEHYREDLWISDPKQAWSFWIGLFESSEKARQVRNTTYLLSQDSGITHVPMRSQKSWWSV